MFGAYELTADLERDKRLALASVVALVVLGAMLAATLVLSARPPPLAKEKSIDVAFRPPPPPPPPAKIENPPPPPPKKVAIPKPPPPVVVEAPVAPPVPVPAAAAMVAPKEIPKTAAPESTVAVAAIQVAVGGQGDGTGTAIGGPRTDEESVAPVEVKAGATGPVNLPEEAEPPEPDEENAAPEYPEAARATGQEARVVLKVVVEKSGTIGRIQVLKGEEPFVSSALAAVKSWRFTPATLDGQPIAVFLTIPVKFSLRE
jgi:protein TonB